MTDQLDYLKSLGVNPILRGGLTLIPVNAAKQVCQLLYQQNKKLYGWEVFELGESGTIKPDLAGIADYSNGTPELEIILGQLSAIDPKNTHIEIIFE